MLWGPLRTYFVVDYMLLRRWNNEKNVHMNLKMGKRLKQQKKVCCYEILRKKIQNLLAPTLR